MKLRRIFAAVVVVGCQRVYADVRLPALISDHMVLQQCGPAHVWGWAAPGEHVSVRFAGQTQPAVADGAGHWSVWLRDLKPAPSAELVVQGNNRLVINDVLVGEVWVASGQSNMERAVHFSLNYEAVAARSSNTKIRLFQVEHAVSAVPAEDVKGHWLVAEAKSIRNFSALAYFFGERFEREHGVPLGLIESAYGGTQIEAWMSRDSLERNPSFAFVGEWWRKVLEDYPAKMQEYEGKLSAWKKTLSPSDLKAVEAGRILADAPAKPRGPGSQAEPSGLYNGMIAPLTFYSVRGVLWNQGENNNVSPHEVYFYRDLFVAMIRDWRTAWGEGDVPFLFMQLSRYKPNSLYALLRESQQKALSLADTGMVVTADVGMSGDVHYPDKETLGARLLGLADQVAYGKTSEGSSPMARQLTTEPGALRVWFDHVGGGLKLMAPPVPEWSVLKPDTPPELTADGKAVAMVPPTAEALARAFVVAGADGVFSAATATVDGDTVLLRSEKVPAPTQACYAWEDSVPAMPLWSKDGLPASPFRTALDGRTEPSCPGSASSPNR